MRAPPRSVLARFALALAALAVLNPSPLPAALPAALARADRAAAAGLSGAAADALGEAAALLPYDGHLADRAGAANLAAGRFAPAEAWVREAARRSGWDPARRMALGDALQGLGDTAGALDQWQLALAGRTRPAERDPVLARLAVGYEAAGDLPQAIAALTQRQQAGAAEPELLYRLALLTAATRPAESVARLTTVVALPSRFTPLAERLLRAVETGLDQGDPAYLYGRVGYELMQLGEWALAAHALSQATALNPEYADAFAYLGLAQDTLGQDGSAAYGQAAALAPDSPLIQYLFGLHYRHLGQSTQALPYLQAAARLDPENPAIAAELGGAYAAQKDLVNAEAAFSRAVQLAPQSAEFWLLLARFHVDFEWKVPEQGLPAARMAVGLDPASASAHDALGYALVVSGDLVNGRRSLDRAVQLDPTLASGHYHLGLMFAVQNRTPEARAALQQALALDPDGPYGNLALKALALLAP